MERGDDCRVSERRVPPAAAASLVLVCALRKTLRTRKRLSGPLRTRRHWETDMQQISKREQAILRVGIIVALLITLWALGFMRSGPIVVY